MLRHLLLRIDVEGVPQVCLRLARRVHQARHLVSHRVALPGEPSVRLAAPHPAARPAGPALGPAAGPEGSHWRHGRPVQQPLLTHSKTRLNLGHRVYKCTHSACVAYRYTCVQMDALASDTTQHSTLRDIGMSILATKLFLY